jgi:hypothetical protein
LTDNSQAPVSDVLNIAFLKADRQLNEKEGQHSGCTAVVAYVEAKKDSKVRERLSFGLVSLTCFNALFLASVFFTQPTSEMHGPFCGR